MDRILIILKKVNGPRASSAPALWLNTIIFKHVYWYKQQISVSVYRTIGPLVCSNFQTLESENFAESSLRFELSSFTLMPSFVADRRESVCKNVGSCHKKAAS